jgi:hypothetical protein
MALTTTDIMAAKIVVAKMICPCFCVIEGGQERWIQRPADVLPLFAFRSPRVFLIQWESTGPGEGKYHVSMVDKSIVEQMAFNPPPMPPELPLRMPATEGE